MAIQRTEINFAVQSKEYAAKQLNAQVCKNWYGVHDESAAFKNPLFPFPGSLLWSDDNNLNKSVRGLYSLNNTLYGVVDDEFRIYNGNGDWNKIGTLNTSQGSVKFMANDNQIFVTDYFDGYVYQVVTTITRAAGTFFRITNASSTIQNPPTFIGSGLNDLVTLGTYVGLTNRTYRVEIDGQSLSSISTPVFYGIGLNDLTAAGNYSGAIDKTFEIMIDGVGTPNTFGWSVDGGVTWTSGVPIVAGPIVLQDRVQITFTNTTGHVYHSYWLFNAIAAGHGDTFRWSQDNGITWVASNIDITGFDQLLSDGVEINFPHITGHSKIDFWTIQVTIDSAFYPPITPIYLDSYGIFPKSNTQRFYISNSEDFSQINALDYASTNAFPDNLVCGVAINEEIFFIGSYTTELWYDTGASPFPLQRRPNLLIHWGTSAPFTLATASNNSLFWLAQNIDGGRVVVEMNNYSVQIISDQTLNDKLQSYGYIDDAFGFIVEWTGKKFYFLTIPSADVTWVYDYDAKVWRQRTTLRTKEDIKDKDYVEGRYLASCHVYHNGEHYIGDWKSGKIYQLSSTYYQDGTMPIINEATSAPLHINLDRMSIHSLQPVFQAATSLPSGQGSDATVMLRYSKDGGYTWSSEIRKPLGKIGETLRRCKFNKLAYGRSIIFNIRISDPVYKVLMGAIIELEDTGS